MDLEARGDTQSSASSTVSSNKENILHPQLAFSLYQKSLSFGFLLSLFVHSLAFYGIFFVSEKVFEFMNKQEKVFRFTLLGEIPNKKRVAPTPSIKAKSGIEKKLSKERKRNTVMPSHDEKVKAIDTNYGSIFEIQDSSARDFQDILIPYPRMSRILGEEGEVLFLLENHSENLIFKKIKTSGFWRLDEAAEKALLAKSENFLKSIINKNIDRVRFVFKLKEAQNM